MIVCQECRQEKPIRARGLCSACYQRAQYARRREQRHQLMVQEAQTLTDEDLFAKSIQELLLLELPDPVKFLLIKYRIDLKLKQTGSESIDVQRRLAELESLTRFIRDQGLLDAFLSYLAAHVPHAP